MAKAFGATVIAQDIDDKRLEMAKSLGADYIINPKTTDPVAKSRRIPMVPALMWPLFVRVEA
jgi:propanol-preferring alcohol dehydrogenase